MTEHADYLAAPEGRRYDGDVGDLRARLQREAWGAGGEWAWRILPDGLLVAMRVRPEDFRKEFRFARRTAAGDWPQEVGSLARQLDIDGWQLTRTAGKLEVFLLEPEPYSDSRRASSEVPCADCGEQTHLDKSFTVQRCTRCAMKAGQAEAQANNQKA